MREYISTYFLQFMVVLWLRFNKIIVNIDYFHVCTGVWNYFMCRIILKGKNRRQCIFSLWQCIFSLWQCIFSLWQCIFSLWQFKFSLWQCIFSLWQYLFSLWYIYTIQYNIAGCSGASVKYADNGKNPNKFAAHQSKHLAT